MEVATLANWKRREFLGAAVVGVIGFLSVFGSIKATSSILVISEADTPENLLSRLRDKGFIVSFTNLSNEGIDLGKVSEYEAVIVTPELANSDFHLLRLLKSLHVSVFVV
jgi:hypothetical protein